MAIRHYIDRQQLVIPSAAAGVSITPSATAWANSSWVQLTTGFSKPIVCVGIAFGPANTAINAWFELEIGKGAATSEVVVGTAKGTSDATAIGGGPNFIQFGIPIFVDANTRLAARLRKSDTTTTTWTMKLVYYEMPDKSLVSLPQPLFSMMGI